MDLILFYFRKLFTVLKNEVLVLPPDRCRALFSHSATLTLFTKDTYLLASSRSPVFCHIGGELDLLSGFTGQMNFGHASSLEWSLWCSAAQ